ncbi:MAG TPA: hypothetical protein VE954_22690 [Oligoflexus sp.]|uniref:c-type cytochrome n=1 Tax=Oligoflexus sp. TaxID=1971216 RepID=UPI002D2792CA|nr:hypothetical protein [Oligoflexus sp.]HYX35918.1 hypothetical protein [Oligoflexus sp.]
MWWEALPTLAQEKPDAARGYSYLVNGGYVGCGVPVTVMKRAVLSKSLVPASVIATFIPMAGEDIFNSGTQLPERNSDNALLIPSMNIFETKRGNKVINFNCLSCHGESIDGNFIVGLGNRTRDFTQEISRFAKVLPLLAWTAEEREEVRAFQRATETISPYIQTNTVGVNPAINLTYALFSQRHAEDYTWSETPTLEPPATIFPPVDVPPWWRMGRKSSMFYSGEFRHSHHRIMMLASTLCVENQKEMRALEKPFYDVEAFGKSLRAPRYPAPIVRETAERGRLVFNQNCSSCHGTYGENGSYPDRIVPIEVVGTDPWLMEHQTGIETQRFWESGEEASQALYGEKFGFHALRGYSAPPLDGIWSTAPFFHNGSVPNLEAVLNSSSRPTYWWKSNTHQSQDYDVAQVGVKFELLNYGYYQGFPFTRRYIYDTTLPGYGNQGHTFGDHLTHDERSAVIEYLKTL